MANPGNITAPKNAALDFGRSFLQKITTRAQEEERRREAESLWNDFKEACKTAASKGDHFVDFLVPNFIDDSGVTVLVERIKEAKLTLVHVCRKDDVNRRYIGASWE